MIPNVITVADIRQEFINLLAREEFVTDKTGVKTLEIVGASFLADEPAIFGTPNHEYINREIAWYKSLSLNVHDIPPPVPEIWKKVGSRAGFINSNYGYLVYSWVNGEQYTHVRDELQKNPNSRRAVMIYTRPSMHTDYNCDGMSDFICTNAVQYVIRSGKLHSIVQMRSNDCWAGYRNDYAWQKHVLDQLARDLFVESGTITWQVGSLHIYEAQFYLVDHFRKTGEHHITKPDYKKLYSSND